MNPRGHSRRDSTATGIRPPDVRDPESAKAGAEKPPPVADSRDGGIHNRLDWSAAQEYHHHHGEKRLGFPEGAHVEQGSGTLHGAGTRADKNDARPLPGGVAAIGHGLPEGDRHGQDAGSEKEGAGGAMNHQRQGYGTAYGVLGEYRTCDEVSVTENSTTQTATTINRATTTTTTTTTTSERTLHEITGPSYPAQSWPPWTYDSSRYHPEQIAPQHGQQHQHLHYQTPGPGFHTTSSAFHPPGSGPPPGTVGYHEQSFHPGSAAFQSSASFQTSGPQFSLDGEWAHHYRPMASTARGGMFGPSPPPGPPGPIPAFMHSATAPAYGSGTMGDPSGEGYHGSVGSGSTDACDSHICMEPGCGKQFASSFSLKRHRAAIHHRDRPFVCTFPGCEKSYVSASNLNTHMRVHSNVRPFKCTFEGCDKKFTAASTLASHRLTHTGERPFLCSEPGCGKSFTRSSHMNSHQRSSHGDKRSGSTAGGNDVMADQYGSAPRQEFVVGPQRNPPAPQPGSPRYERASLAVTPAPQLSAGRSPSISSNVAPADTDTPMSTVPGPGANTTGTTWPGPDSDVGREGVRSDTGALYGSSSMAWSPAPPRPESVTRTYSYGPPGTLHSGEDGGGVSSTGVGMMSSSYEHPHWLCPGLPSFRRGGSVPDASSHHGMAYPPHAWPTQRRSYPMLARGAILHTPARHPPQHFYPDTAPFGTHGGGGSAGGVQYPYAPGHHVLSHPQRFSVPNIQHTGPVRADEFSRYPDPASGGSGATRYQTAPGGGTDTMTEPNVYGEEQAYLSSAGSSSAGRLPYDRLDDHRGEATAPQQQYFHHHRPSTQQGDGLSAHTPTYPPPHQQQQPGQMPRSGSAAEGGQYDAENYTDHQRHSAQLPPLHYQRFHDNAEPSHGDGSSPSNSPHSSEQS